MKKSKQLFVTLSFIFVCIVMCIVLFIGGTSGVYAAATMDSGLSLHEQTKIYNSHNSDYFNGCEDYANYVNESPEITVLTHGLGSKSYYWSNDLSVNNGEQLAYNSSSLIEKICQELKGEVLIYFAKCDSPKSFTLTQLSRELKQIKATNRLDDVSKHIVLIYESSIPDNSNDDVYNEFEFVLDTISLQYKSLTGVLPRFNLVGHSRGGLTNIMYATEHPYNVASIYSLGTPFNCSTLAGIDFVLDMLGYYDKENDEFLSAGAQSILDYDEAVRIRDAWNNAFTPDVNMNVVAYGSMTSINYISAMLQDTANGGSEYAPVVDKYLDLLKTVLNVVNDCPNIVGIGLDFIQGLAKVSNVFGINLYDEVLKNISGNLEGDVTYDEGQNILSLYNVINEQAVIMDDLFIDTDSQLGYGFKDEVDYNGFKRYIKIFDVEDLTANRSIPSLPAVVHNMETMNETYTRAISSSLVYGTHSSNVVVLQDDELTSVSFLGEKAFSFISGYSGKREFTAVGSTVTLYMYNSDNGLDFVTSDNNSLTYTFKGNQKYLIVISKNINGNTDVSLKLVDFLNITDNVVNISAKDQIKVKINAQKSGYYLISTNSNSVAVISGAIEYTSGKYYQYLSASTPNYLCLKNSASNDVTAVISITEPQEIALEDGEFTVDSTQKVVKFTNPYSQSIQYKLKIDWTTSTSQNAYIRTQNGSSLGSVVTGANTITNSFTLSANQSCYIIFSNTSKVIKANLTVNENQLKWKINGVANPTTTTLARGYSYNLRLVLYANGQELDYYSGWAYTQKTEYFTISNSQLNIKNNALVGYDIVIIPTVAPDYLLTITIGYNNGFSYSVSNGDSIVLNWNTTLYNEALQAINLKIVSNSVTYSLTLTSASGSRDISSYISPKTGTSTISIVSIKISGITFNNGTSFLNKSSLTINNLYGGGSGTSASPYLISCYRHLINISKNNSAYYKLTNNINLGGKGDWSPIQSFYGNIAGDSYTISNMKVNVSTSEKHYGFFETNYGTISNLKFSYASIYTTVSSISSDLYIGVVSGNNYGNVKNCDVSNADIDVQFYHTYVGGIVGQNRSSGYVYDSDLSNSNMKVSGRAGGIVGNNDGTVDYSYVSSTNIRYYWKSGNGSIGGIVGYNSNSGTVKRCNSGAYIEWYSSSKSKDILPSIGGVIGWNAGSYSDCNYTGEYYYECYYWHFIVWYDQDGRCFKVDDKKVGHNA